MQILENVEYIVAMELLCAAQAVEFRGSEKLGKGTRTAYATIRKAIPMLEEDKVLSEDIEKIRQMVKTRMTIDEIEKMLKID
jgi:histidine ammonia-lyase